jgi:hypothetical protein
VSPKGFFGKKMKINLTKQHVGKLAFIILIAIFGKDIAQSAISVLGG